MKKIALLFVLLLVSASSFAADGVMNIESNYSVSETSERVESILAEKGMTIFGVVPHSSAAKEKAGIELRDTTLVIFGNPKVGSPLMKCKQSIAIDLPQKALVWEDEGGKVWISYNDPHYLKARHGVEGCDEVFMKVSNALASLLGAAAK